MILKSIMLIAFGFLMATNSRAGFYGEHEMRTFFSKNKACILAIGLFNPNMGYPQLKSGGRNLGSFAYCVTDVEANPGTIREKKGCGFVSYDVESGNMLSTYSNYEDPKKTLGLQYAMAEGVDCYSGGFEKLLKLYPGSGLGSSSVGEFLSSGPKQGKAEKVFLFASHGRFEKHWKANYKGGVAKEARPQKIDCSKKHLVAGITEEESWECSSKEDLKLEMCNNEFKDLKKIDKSNRHSILAVQARIDKMNKYFKMKSGGIALKAENCN